MFEFLGKLFRSGRRLRPAGVARPAGPAVSGAAGAGRPDAVAAWERDAGRRIDRRASAEELCGVSSAMTKDEIREQLARLYQRHNRAASSLDAALREDAEFMLDAVVQCREKFLDDRPGGGGGESPQAPGGRR
jgi:hypothetical protein